jgi:hypothetical protein
MICAHPRKPVLLAPNSRRTRVLWRLSATSALPLP